jgi:hypothetical protein
MTSWATNLCRSFATATALFTAASLPAQSPLLRHPSAAQGKQLVAAIDQHQLPAGAQVTPFPSQTFVLTAPGTQTLGLVPVYFRFQPTGPELSEQCGIFFVQPDKTSSYLPVVGPDPKVFSSSCVRVEAIGEVSHSSSPRPSLILLCQVEAPDGRNYTADFLLVWDPKQQRYTVDRPTSEWIASRLHQITIAGVRKVLAENHR